MKEGVAFELGAFPVHLGLGARVVVQERFAGDMGWYERYAERNASDGLEGRLVSLHSFTSPWESWEMHPEGEELVVCMSGRITLLQEIGGEVRAVTLEAGQAVVNPRGVWHTADVEAESTALFVTAGAGTEVRARETG